MRDKKLASPKPTAGTEVGGGISCFHFWSEAFRSIIKSPHRHAALFFCSAHLPRRGIASPRKQESREGKGPSKLEARTCRTSHSEMNVCAWTGGMGRSSPKPRSNLWLRAPVGIRSFFPPLLESFFFFPSASCLHHPIPTPIHQLTLPAALSPNSLGPLRHFARVSTLARPVTGVTI